MNYINSIPYHVKLNIIDYCNDFDLLNLSKTSKFFYTICKQPLNERIFQFIQDRTTAENVLDPKKVTSLKFKNQGGQPIRASKSDSSLHKSNHSDSSLDESNQLDLLKKLNLLKKLPKLKSLTLAGLNLETFPDVLPKLTNLACIDLSNNHISEIPPEISRLTNLTQLNLANNKLSEFPPVLTTLSQKIKKINLTDNPIAVIPGNLDFEKVQLSPEGLKYGPNLEHPGSPVLKESQLLSSNSRTQKEIDIEALKDRIAKLQQRIISETTPQPPGGFKKEE